MIQRILNARNFLACILAAVTGMALYFRAPFPDANLFLHVMAIRSSSAFLFFKYSYILFLYTTPYIAYSVLLSGVYIFAQTSPLGNAELANPSRTRTLYRYRHRGRSRVGKNGGVHVSIRRTDSCVQGD